MAELRSAAAETDAAAAGAADVDSEALPLSGGPSLAPRRRWGRALAAAPAAALLAGGAVLLLSAPGPVATGRGVRGGTTAAAPEAVVLDEESDRQVQTGVCVVDAHQAAFYLMQAGNFIRFATLDCPDAKKHEDRLVCAAEVSTVIDSITWTAAYIAASVNSCGMDRNVGAACAASLAALVAELGDFSFIATSVVQACEVEEHTKVQEDTKAHHHHHHHHHPHSHSPERRLGHLNGTQSRPPSPAEVMRPFADHVAEMKLTERKLKNKWKEVAEAEEEWQRRRVRISQCVVDVNLGPGFLARAGFQIYYLNQACPSSDPEDRKSCALDVFNVISSFAWAAQFLAQIAVDCPLIPRVRAGCAAVVADFVAAVAALGPIVNGVADDCPAASRAAVNATAVAALPVGFADFFG